MKLKITDMEIIDGAKFKTNIKEGLSGGYLFYGEEEYLKRNALRTARKSVLADGSEAFDFSSFDEDNYSPEALETAISTLPVFSQKRFTELHCFDFTKAKVGEIRALENILASLSDNGDSIFVLYLMPHELDVGTPKKPSKNFKILTENLTPVLFERQSREKLIKWAGMHFRHNGVEITCEMCEKFLDRCGRDMFALDSECDKISAYVLSQGRNTVKENDLLLMATENTQFGAFDLANAVMSGDTDKALAILASQKFSDTAGNDVGLTLGSIASVYRDMYNISVLKETGLGYRDIAKKIKIHEYRCSIYYNSLKNKSTSDIERLITLCANADKTLKTDFSQKNGYDILIRLVIEASVYG